MDHPTTNRSRPSDAARQAAREILATLGSPDSQHPFGTHIWDDHMGAAVAAVIPQNVDLLVQVVERTESMLDIIMSGPSGYRRLDEGHTTGRGALGRHIRTAVRNDPALIPLALRWEAAHRAWSSPHHRVLPKHAWHDQNSTVMTLRQSVRHPGTPDPTPLAIPVLDTRIIQDAWQDCDPLSRQRILTSALRWCLDGDQGAGIFISACV